MPARRSGPRGKTSTLLRALMLAHAAVESVEFLVNSALGVAPLELVARSQVDKARVSGQARVDLVDPAVHLLGEPAGVGVALRPGAQLAQGGELAHACPGRAADVEGQ